MPRSHSRERTRPTTRRRPTRRTAFTLLEIIVVVTIIALLATLVAPRVWDNIARSKERVATAEVKSLAVTVRNYLIDHGEGRPPQDFDLDVLLSGDDPYLDKAEDLLDPWENPYMIVIPGEVNRDFDIVSAGEDGEFGTEDDITN